MTNTANETGREGLAGQTSSQVQAGELKQQGRSKLGDALDQRTTQAGQQAHQVAQALRRSSEQLRQNGEAGQAAGVTEGAADRIERAGSYLESASGDELLRDVEDFARRRPWMIAGIGLMAGLAASRFLKASSEGRYASGEQSRYTSRYGYGYAEAASGDADDPIARETVSSR